MPQKINPMDDQDKVVVRTEEEIKTSIISELGLDPEVDAERITKLTARELDHDKKLSSAIGAKIKHRDENVELKKKLPVEAPLKTEETKDLTSKDTIALINAKVPEEDIDDVVEFAKFKGISVTDALKSSIVKTTLSEKAEFRRTAAAANVNVNKRAATQVDDSVVLEGAFKKGEIPERGSEEADRLFWARHGGKK